MTDRTILTTKDLTILEALRDRLPDAADPLRPLIERKIARALVMLRAEVPRDVATLSSRVSYRVGVTETDTRVLSATIRDSAAVGLFLPITTRRGLALLGLREGQMVTIEGGERLTLEKVYYQPEAAQAEAVARAQIARPEARRKALRVVGGGR